MNEKWIKFFNLDVKTHNIDEPTVYAIFSVVNLGGLPRKCAYQRLLFKI
jgi:hypothetical protein